MEQKIKKMLKWYYNKLNAKEENPIMMASAFFVAGTLSLGCTILTNKIAVLLDILWKLNKTQRGWKMKIKTKLKGGPIKNDKPNTKN